MNQYLIKRFLSFVILFWFMLFQTPVYGTITINNEPGTNPELSGIVQKVVDAFNEIVEQKLKVKLTRDVKIFVCPNTNSFVNVLQREFEMPKIWAMQQAKISGGIAQSKKRIIAINLDPDDIYEPEYYAYHTTAHELVHQLQFQLADDKLTKSPYWLIEGTAEFFAAEVVADMGYQSVTAWKTMQFYVIRNSESHISPNKLGYISFSQWQQYVGDWKLPYQVSSLMVTYLMSQTKMDRYDAVVSYFKGLGAELDEDVNFKQSFGTVHSDFINRVEDWFRASIVYLGEAEIDSKGNFDQYIAVSEGFSRSQLFFKVTFGKILPTKQKIILAPEKYSYALMLQKELKMNKSEVINSRNEPWSLMRNKTIMNLEAMPDCESQIYQTAVMMSIRFQEQQTSTKLIENMPWLKYGAAYIFAAIICGQAEAGTFEYYRKKWNQAIAESSEFLSLSKLQSQKEWDEAIRRFGVETVFSFAALAVEKLIDNNGVEVFRSWFEVSQVEKNPQIAFKKVFGVTQEEFYLVIDDCIQVNR